MARIVHNLIDLIGHRTLLCLSPNPVLSSKTKKVGKKMAFTIFGLFNDEQREDMGVHDTTVRISLGLENPEDILNDIRQALA